MTLDRHRRRRPRRTRWGSRGSARRGRSPSPPAVINAVIDAVSHLGVRDDRQAGVARTRLASDPATRKGGGGMIPAAFDYERAESVDHADRAAGAVRRRRQAPRRRAFAAAADAAASGAAVAAGRHRPDLAICPYVREDGDDVAIGALTRHHDVANSEVLQDAVPDRRAHGRADRRPAGPAHGDDRRLGRARRPGLRHAHGRCWRSTPRSWRAGRGASRTMAAGEFFKGLFTTALAPNEVLTEIRVPEDDRPAGAT